MPEYPAASTAVATFTFLTRYFKKSLKHVRRREREILLNKLSCVPYKRTPHEPMHARNIEGKAEEDLTTTASTTG